MKTSEAIVVVEYAIQGEPLGKGKTPTELHYTFVGAAVEFIAHLQAAQHTLLKVIQYTELEVVGSQYLGWYNGVDIDN